MDGALDDAADDAALIAEARAAAANAYAPYSRFHVGSAVRSARGAIYAGCNVENISYPVGVCAERNAIAAGVATEGAGFRIDAIAVLAFGPAGDAPCAPCGACRQAILEFGAAARVLYRGADLGLRRDVIGVLLPGAFSFNGG